MCSCIKKIRWNKVLLTGVIYLVIATIIHQVEAMLTLDYYKMPEYFGVWSRLMMSEAGPPPARFLLTSLLFSFLSGITLAAFYDFIKGLLPKDRWQKTFEFTAIVVVLSFVFFTLPLYLLINLPFALLVSWLISSVNIFFLAAIVFVKVLK